MRWIRVPAEELTLLRAIQINVWCLLKGPTMSRADEQRLRNAILANLEAYDNAKKRRIHS